MKVCVIYSGQTRSYNANHALWESHEKMATELKQRYDIEVDFIGHTWADQERPWNNSDFLHFGQAPPTLPQALAKPTREIFELIYNNVLETTT